MCFIIGRKSATCSPLNSLKFLSELGENVCFAFSVSLTITPSGKMLGKHVKINIAEPALRD
jgi:hypothetical protein